MFWPSEIEMVLDHWQNSGYCSVGDRMFDLHASGYILSKNDLHLIYHALWSSGPNNSRLSDYTVWTNRMPK